MSTSGHLLAGRERVDYHSSDNQTAQYAGHFAVSSEAPYDQIRNIRTEYIAGHIDTALEARHLNTKRQLKAITDTEVKEIYLNAIQAQRIIS